MTDTLLPKNDDKELMEILKAVAYKAYCDANGYNYPPDELILAPHEAYDRIRARDTKMLEQARLETEIKIHDEYWHSQRYVQEHGIGPFALANKEATDLELRKLKGESK